LVIKALDPDWIRIRIGVHPKMLDPDEMNADPQPCFLVNPDFQIKIFDEKNFVSDFFSSNCNTFLFQGLHEGLACYGISL
jgi:hypothetical protein